MPVESGLAVVAGFTPSQVEAAEYRSQDACVVAGPGSGKTTVLVERYRALLVDHRFDPHQILAITFTEKAAANMKAKLAAQFEHDPVMLRELDAAWVSTIHGFCARVLRENAIAAGIDPRYRVLDARESEDLQYECLHAALDEFVHERRAEALQLIEALQTPWIAGDLMNAYDAIRSAGKSIQEVRAIAGPGCETGLAEFALRLLGLVNDWPAQLTVPRREQRSALVEWAQRLAVSDSSELLEIRHLLDSCPINLRRVPDAGKEALKQYREDLGDLLAQAVDRHTARFRGMVFDMIERFDKLYAERKSAAASLDFNDLERRTIELLRRDTSVRARIRSQFRQVMLDEFQDINQQQSELISLVRGEDVFFAVGDMNQSIYGFRHARPEIFSDYRAAIARAGKHSAELLHNFRSRAEILRCVETLLNSRDGIDRRELVAGTVFEEKHDPSIEILKVQANDKEEAAAREARWIGHRILSLRGDLELAGGRRADFRDFAVLCRNGESMKPILEAFDFAGIPYVCGRRQSFLLSREGRDITALLHMVANPRDGISMATVLRSPLVGLGDEALLRVRLLAGSVTGGLNVIAHDPAKLADFAPDDAARLERFTQNLKHWRALQPVTSLDVFIGRVLRDCGFEWKPGTAIAANIENFLELARFRGADRPLLHFLHELESLENAIAAESDLADQDVGNSVQVMTAHAAKGLEFPIVIIAAMDKGTQRNSAPVTFTPDFGLGLKWSDTVCEKPNKDGLEDSWQRRNSQALEQRDKQESNRLLYVAMTRAEEHLILSYSVSDRRPSNWAKVVEERFQLNSLAPSSEPQILAGAAFQPAAGFDVLFRYWAEEPPPLGSPDNAFDGGGRQPDESGVLTIPYPVLRSQHDSAVNVTSLAVFASCPRKYYIQRYIGWNGTRFTPLDPEELPPDEPDSDLPETTAAELGSLVHEILAGKSGAYPQEAHQLADAFLKSELGARAAMSERSAREWEFILDLDGTLVRGMIDLWFEHNGEISIVDYKTDDVAATGLDRRVAEYAPQLALYGLALERAFGRRPTQAWLHFLRLDQIMEVPVDDEAMRQVRELIGRLRDAQNSLRFDLNEGEYCRTCPFHRGLCPAS
jgi:ATP-dependent helicase/nuclease subunit A